MAELGDLTVRLSADTAEFQSDLGRAARIAEATGQQIATAMRVGTAGLVAFGAAAATLVKQAVDAADELNKLSQRTGFTVERLSELSFAAKLSDVSMGQLTGAMGKFNAELSEAAQEGSRSAQIFKALGVDITQGPQQAFEQATKAIAGLTDQAQKVAVLRELFGRAGDALIPFINSLEESTETARRLGIVIGPEFAAKAEQLKDSLTTLGSATQAIGVSLGTAVVPALAEITANLVRAETAGQKLKTLLLEFVKIGLAGSSAIAQAVLPAPLAELFDEGTAALFRATTPTAEPGAGGGAAPNVNTSALGQALEKGRKRGGAGRSKDDAEKNARLLVEAEEQAAKDSADAWKAWEAIQLKNHKETADAWALQWKQVFETIDREQEDAIKQTEDMIRMQKKDMKEANDTARDFALTLTSAFSQAIVDGGKFSDVLKGIGKDLLQIFARQGIESLFKILLGDGKTKGGDAGSAGSGASGLLGSLLSTIFGGGGSAPNVPSYDVGTPFVPRDQLAFVHRGEQIIPAGQSAGGVAISNVYNIDSRADRSQIIRDIEAGNQRSQAQILESLQRGGRFAKAVGRA